WRRGASQHTGGERNTGSGERMMAVGLSLRLVG
ncbi:hypothetical protein A2U01_0116752, partial [Trifolium medium]|nr:hypothetical protein [Trifolium medium]